MDARRQQKSVATAQAYDQGNIRGLDDAMTRRLIASTVYTESNGGDLEITNRQGYIGRYQAGAGWLADAGYVDQEKLRTAMSGYRSEWAWAETGGMTRFLQDPRNWNDGLNVDTYKARPDLQDQAFKINSDAAYQRAVRNELLDENDAPDRIAGFLKARHIAGYGGAKAVLEGRAPRSDSNGTSNYDYFNDIARNEDGLDRLMTQVPALVSSETVRAQRPSAPAGTRDDEILRDGDRGTEVRHLQAQLNRLGYRDAQGRTLATDGDFGDRTEQAVMAFQREHGLARVDGEVGSRTAAALRIAEGRPLLSSPDHPDHPLYLQALSGMQQLAPGTFSNDAERNNAAATLAFEARARGVGQIDHVVLSVDGSRIFAVQGALADPAHFRMHVDRAQAVTHPVERSSEQLREELARQEQAQTHMHAQQHVEHRGVTMGIRP